MALYDQIEIYRHGQNVLSRKVNRTPINRKGLIMARALTDQELLAELGALKAEISQDERMAYFYAIGYEGDDGAWHIIPRRSSADEIIAALDKMIEFFS